MKLLLKLNLLLVAVFGVGLVLIATLANGFLQKQAESQVLREAGLISASAIATREYTEAQVSPLLEKTAQHAQTFLPQAIPFFAATTTFDQIRKTYPDYTYKEATLNPTNLRDRATDWEADIINHFRDTPGDAELVRTRNSATGPTLYLAHPIKVEQGCLTCHSTPAAAPKALLAHYGSAHGFGWNLGEVVGAQIIAVPTSVPEQMAHRGLNELLIDLGVIFLVAVLLIDVGLYLIVIRPLRLISDSAELISHGELELDPLPVRGRDEVALVTQSFNRMHTSLKKAMDLLNG